MPFAILEIDRFSFLLPVIDPPPMSAFLQ